VGVGFIDAQAQRFGERKVLVTGMIIVGMAQVFSMPLFGPPLMTRNVTNTTNHSRVPVGPGSNHSYPNGSFSFGGSSLDYERYGGGQGAAILGGDGNYYENYGEGPTHDHCGQGSVVFSPVCRGHNTQTPVCSKRTGLGGGVRRARFRQGREAGVGVRGAKRAREEAGVAELLWGAS
jgi:hypothetical protein